MKKILLFLSFSLFSLTHAMETEPQANNTLLQAIIALNNETSKNPTELESLQNALDLSSQKPEQRVDTHELGLAKQKKYDLYLIAQQQLKSSGTIKNPTVKQNPALVTFLANLSAQFHLNQHIAVVGEDNFREKNDLLALSRLSVCKCNMTTIPERILHIVSFIAKISQQDSTKKNNDVVITSFGSGYLLHEYILCWAIYNILKKRVFLNGIDNFDFENTEKRKTIVTILFNSTPLAQQNKIMLNLFDSARKYTEHCAMFPTYRADFSLAIDLEPSNLVGTPKDKYSFLSTIIITTTDLKRLLAAYTTDFQGRFYGTTPLDEKKEKELCAKVAKKFPLTFNFNYIYNEIIKPTIEAVDPAIEKPAAEMIRDHHYEFFEMIRKTFKNQESSFSIIRNHYHQIENCINLFNNDFKLKLPPDFPTNENKGMFPFPITLQKPPTMIELPKNHPTRQELIPNK